MGKSEIGDLRRKERNKIRRWTRAAPREKATNSEERACTNVQKEKKNKNERERQIESRMKERTGQRGNAMQKLEQYKQMCERKSEKERGEKER